MAFSKIRYYRLALILGLLVLSLLVGFLLLSFIAQDPPVIKIEEARKAISEAIKVEADLYASKELIAAENKWAQAMDNWKENNAKSPLLRNYKETKQFANAAIESAEKAKKNAINRKKELRLSIKESIENLRTSVDYIELATSKLPLNHNIRKSITPAALKLNEVESAFKRNDLLTANSNLKALETKIFDLKKLTEQLLEDYFSNYAEWVKLDEEMKHWSKVNNSVSLVVDKFSRKCIVYKSGKKIRVFDVELSVNWLGDKIQKGDKATPEGKYSVSVKKTGSKTIYYKSLEINFPNNDDKLRFEQEKANGRIPKNAKIGGSIAIHGEGGKGIDWTEGCVALENKDMDSLFSLCKVGTPVAIVGSLFPLDKILEN
jgi:hypothetical protein